MCPMAVVPSASVMRALLLLPLCGEPPAAACSEASPEASAASLPCRHKAQFYHLVLLYASYMLQAASMSCAAAGMLGVACMSVRPVTCIYMQAQSRNTCISDGYSICLKRSWISCGHAQCSLTIQCSLEACACVARSQTYLFVNYVTTLFEAIRQHFLQVENAAAYVTKPHISECYADEEIDIVYSKKITPLH